jgi:hypothetical protein
MKQSRISAMERPGETQFNVETLIRLAAAMKVALRVEFVSFSEMLEWENNFSQDAFNVRAIDNDIAFVDPQAGAAVAQTARPTWLASHHTSFARANVIIAADQPPSGWVELTAKRDVEDEYVRQLATRGQGFQAETGFLPIFYKTAVTHEETHYGPIRTA